MTDETKALVERCKGHTPGPWRVDGPPHNQIVWNGPESRICFMAHSNGVDNERDIATGNLVAAAPELLDLIETQAREIERLREALQWMVDNDETNEGDEPIAELGGKSWDEINAYWIDGLNRARAALKGGGHD